MFAWVKGTLEACCIIHKQQRLSDGSYLAVKRFFSCPLPMSPDNNTYHMYKMLGHDKGKRYKFYRVENGEGTFFCCCRVRFSIFLPGEREKLDLIMEQWQHWGRRHSRFEAEAGCHLAQGWEAILNHTVVNLCSITSRARFSRRYDHMYESRALRRMKNRHVGLIGTTTARVVCLLQGICSPIDV